MNKLLRIVGGVLIGVASCVALIFIWADFSHIWQWLEGTHEWFPPFDFVAWLWILLFLSLGLRLVQLADRRESQGAGIPTPITNQPSVGYLRQHWRGDHSLAHGIWVNTVLLLFAFYGFWRFWFNNSPDLGIASYEAPIVHALSFYIIPWVIFLALVSWQLVGLLRAAQRRINASSSFLSWDSARSVRLLVAISFLAVFYPLVFHAVPDAYEGAIIILEDMADDKYTLTVRNGGTELEIRGGMRFGLTEEVNRYVTMNPGIKVVHLNSKGGRALEGEGLLGLIRRHQLITYSSIECSSACTLAFIGGTKRYINKHARLGFHDGYTHSQIDLGIDNRNDVTLYNAIEEVTRKEKLYYLEAGVDRDFTERLFSSLTIYEMQYPSPEKLLKAGVVHGLTDRVELVLP